MPDMLDSRRRIFISHAIFVAVFLAGVVGFKFIAKGGTWLDSLYMTVITLSTVGYEEAIDLSANPAARIFAAVFILASIGTIAFVVSSITSFIVEGELKNILGRKRMEKKIAKLKDHFIVCGTGDTAMTVIQELLLTKRNFVVVEPHTEIIEKLSASGDILFIQGDPSEDDALIKAGIERAQGILMALPTDEANLFVTITARSLNPQIRIITKGIDIRSHPKMVKAGSNAVVSPANIGGMRMVSEMIRPSVVSFLDLMLREREKNLRFEEAIVKSNSHLIGKKLCESQVKEKTGALIVAIKRGDPETLIFNPTRDTEIQENDVLILIASPENLEKLEHFVGRD